MIRKRKAGRPPLTKGENAIRVGFTVTAKEWLKVMKICEDERISYSEFLREAIKNFIDEKGKK
jgi:hypothetical protein